MAVKIRLRRMGSRGKPFYRMVVADSRSPRDGRFIDTLGYYDPRTEPATIKIDETKALLWLSRGAQPSDTAAALLKKESIMEKFAATKTKPEKVRQVPPPPAEVAAVEETEAKPVKSRARKSTGEKTTATRKKKTEETEAPPAEPEAVASEAEPAAESEAASEEQPSEEQG